MRTTINLTLPQRTAGCFMRDPGKADVVDTFYAHKGIRVLCGRDENRWQLRDWAAERLASAGLIDGQTLAAYERQVYALFHDADCASAESLDGAIQQARCRIFGAEAMERLQRETAAAGCDFDPSAGIDQRGLKAAALRRAAVVIFVCDDGRLWPLVRSDVDAALMAGKAVYLAAHSQPGGDLPDETRLKALLGEAAVGLLHLRGGALHAQDDMETARLNGLIARGRALVYFYGETGLLACRGLRADAVVHAIPQGYYARALTNQFDVDRACVVWIPLGLDVPQWVPLRDRTVLNYHHLFLLQAAHGEGIYACSPARLHRLYPQRFVNIYDGSIPPMECPVRMADGEAYTDAGREAAVASFLGGMPNLVYRACYADEAGAIHTVSDQADQVRRGVMVHSVMVRRAGPSRVVNCEGYPSLRRMIREEKMGGVRIWSNFLFFLTSVLAHLYNTLRSDRPREQIDFDRQHLDYMLIRDGDHRRETFPLFRKACIAMKADGTCLFVNFRLGGGELRVGGETLRWAREDVDPAAALGRQTCVYTPHLSNADLDADAASYVKPVGAGRVNLVIIQDRIICIRRGEVLLPSIGAVVSLEEQAGLRLLRACGLPLTCDGYADGTMPAMALQLDPPEGVAPGEWAQVQWACGGGLSLILDGRGICDGGDAGLLACLEAEGWMSPLSRQTQESALHVPARHPRTAIGVTGAGALVILVYSGRTRLSAGADYGQMIHVARRLYPDIRCLMNVDGGGSAMLGLSVDGSFMEVSCPSTSQDSCAGMVRPVNTALCIEWTQK